MLTLGIIRMTSLRLGQKKKKKITYFDIIAGSTLEMMACLQDSKGKLSTTHKMKHHGYDAPPHAPITQSYTVFSLRPHEYLIRERSLKYQTHVCPATC